MYNCTYEDRIGTSHAPLAPTHRKTNAVVELSRAWAKRCNQPHSNHNAALRAAAIVSGLVAFLMVGIRIVARLCTVRFWWDDWCHITAGVCWNDTRWFIEMTSNGATQVLAIPLTIFSNLCTFIILAGPREQVADSNRCYRWHGIPFVRYQIFINDSSSESLHMV